LTATYAGPDRARLLYVFIRSAGGRPRWQASRARRAAAVRPFRANSWRDRSGVTVPTRPFRH